jgi:micrococcal nuclease
MSSSAIALAVGLLVTDGDTFKLPSGEAIRLSNIDTPEKGARAKCDAERFLAVHARYGLTRLLERGSIEIVREPRPDKYGRSLARVRAGGVDVGEALINQALAVKWEGRRHNWCGR